MKYLLFILVPITLSFVSSITLNVPLSNSLKEALNKPIVPDNKNDWQYFLQHLPLANKPIIDYRRRVISYQQKHIAIVEYDVGTTDLQQCADALIRLRSEYLFSRKRFDEIGFHFMDGHFYTWNDYCSGLLPFLKRNKIEFRRKLPSLKTHESLRSYLDIVYTYACTISLAKELKNTDKFEIGTVVIHPGSPGHCFIIIDETINEKGEKLFKLAEGYTPAQSIYVLRNLDEKGVSPWYRLHHGTIETASYVFTDYELKKFE